MNSPGTGKQEWNKDLSIFKHRLGFGALVHLHEGILNKKVSAYLKKYKVYLRAPDFFRIRSEYWHWTETRDFCNMCPHVAHELHMCSFPRSRDLAADHMCFTYAFYGSHLLSTFLPDSRHPCYITICCNN